MEPNDLLNTVRAHKLAVLIFDARTAAGKSLDEVSAQTGIAAGDLSAYENGDKIPSLPEVEALAYVLDAPIDHFWGRQSLSEGKAEPSRTLNPKILMVRQKMISSFLALKREENGISLAELSRLSGVSEEKIKVYENADKPVPIYDLDALAKALGLTVDEFYDQRGAVAEWRKTRGGSQPKSNLPADIQAFVDKPINQPYLELAMKFSELPADKLRTVAESILEITL